ncbi:MAG: hypothetical protein SGPRY_006201 [Prymnesium sp.]
MMTDLLADTSGLISALGDSSKANRAGAQLHAMIESGGAATLLETLLPQMVGMEGVRSTGGQRMVAQLLSDATHNLGSDALSHLPRIVELTAHALGDGEASVREAFASSLAQAARNTSRDATGRQLLPLLFRPLLQLLDKPNRPLQHGAARALREVIRSLQPAQLRAALPSLVNSLRRHLKSVGTHGRASLLECAAGLLQALPDHFTPYTLAVLPLALQASRESM